ncbi:GGDEF domain-containing protein [Pseudocitrobacter cyperus]|uniref:Sensor domain-containing diguanylate cyclase n=1 Tax=Pseudocitrobacter cyperus TaxID=3112843 RepID=A0ABV0HFG6_9ENTR
MSDNILARVTHTLATEQSLESLVRQLLEMLELVTNMESTYLTRIDTDAQIQHIVYARNSGDMTIPENAFVPWDESLCKRAMEENFFFCNDVDVHWADCERARELGIITFLSTPVHLADGSLYGTLCASSSQRTPFNLNGEQVLQLFASIIAHYIEKESLVTQLKAANAALLYHSYTDELTGLPNRRAVFEDLNTLFAHARKVDCRVTLAFIDLDYFKAINDLYGHHCGDQFLQQVGQRLFAFKHEDGLVGRLGGDEFLFAVLSTAVTAYPDFTAALHEQFSGDYPLTETTIHYPGASIGVVDIDPVTTDVENALRAADNAMYQDKKLRRKMQSPWHIG